MVHGVEPILPFDVTEATFLVPKLDKPLSHEELITLHSIFHYRLTLPSSPCNYSHCSRGIYIGPINLWTETPSEATTDGSLSLIAIRARQLEKRQEDLDLIKERVLKARYASIAQFEKENANLIIDYDFSPGSLVLVRNSSIETDLSRKTKPRYLGPLVVIRRTRNKAYILAELDGAIHRTPYAAFRLIPYYPRSRTIVPITSLVDAQDISQDE
ncbi:hypothetical protein M422DRAFT_249746 [Sphaerobolus stellatus SS14]|uniref:Uncharacterized protein n=1 Tax=Sphaerobolus stellatus (strain SS14) TaxID=990650 RepID=A0A0C9W4Q3_SPHS4|nr:hypothetical protein M422DRAFT_249746 [Sphaerobolus stellatus SS14]